MLLFRISLSLFVLMHVFASIESAKILAISPYHGRSQYISIEALLKALAARGHELTVVSRFPQKEKIPNFRDIVLEKSPYHEDFLKTMLYTDDQKKYSTWHLFFRNATIAVLENKEVQELLFIKKQHFDLVITEINLTEALYAIATHLNAHLIGFCTGGTDAGIDQWTGNPSPSSYLPLVSTPYTDKMDFWQRMDNLKEVFYSWHFLNFPHLEDQREIYEKYFPHLPHQLEEVSKNFSLVLLNQHFSISFPRPYVPNVIEVGGMFIQHNLEEGLPKEIKDFIEGAEDGVIYFSMGSNVKADYLEEEKREAILKVLGSLKQRVLWKFDKLDISEKPSNIMIRSWFPQADILAHPKVKLFISHCGLLGTTEAVYHAKPIVGIPLYYDQFQNMATVKQKGFGTDIEYKHLTEETLKKAILEVLENDSYANAARVLSKRYHDQPMKPLDLAIYWTEYILRHDGAPFMRVHAKNLNLFQYFCLDVISFIIFEFILSFLLLLVLLYLAFRLGRKLLSRESKKKNELSKLSRYYD